MSSLTQSITKRVNVRTGNGKVMGVAREQYLRSDLPCCSELCFEESCRARFPSSKTLSLLPKDTTHYLLPLEDVVKNYLEVLQSRHLRGLILLQSVVNVVQLQSLKHYRKVCALVKDSGKKGAVFFPNEFSQQTFVRRDNAETLAHWRSRMGFKAAEWYYEHLGGQKPIILLTEDPNVVNDLSNKRIEIFVMGVKEYLEKFWPDLSDVMDLYSGISEALHHKDEPKDLDGGFTEYLSEAVLNVGLKKGRFIQGKLSVNKHHASQEAFVTRNGGGDKDNEDILIPGRALRNRAVHGDIVIVEMLPKSQWKSKLNRLAARKKEETEEVWEKRADVSPTAKVVGIAQRKWGEYVATIPKEEAETMARKTAKRILVCPYDYRIPKVRVVTSQAARLAGQRVVVRLDSWPISSQYPNGHFVRSLGQIGDLETEIDGILLENDISVAPFSQGIMNEMPSEDWKPESDLGKRKDLRKSHMVMSIDPQGCTDVDDTLSVRKLNNGHVELGVHIADVTHFVPANSLTDMEARRRATTVYLADRRYDMLPAILSSNLCSLLGGKDRYAVSVLWELDPNADYEVVSVWYGRTLIRSSYKLFYEAAQEVIDGRKTPEEIKKIIPELGKFSGQGLEKKFRFLRETLVTMTAIGRSMQRKRERDGALQLESTEVRFEFETSASPEEIVPKEHLDIHETVAECMILANHWVARKIAKTYPSRALLRKHLHPKKENFEELKKCAASRKWRVNVGSNRLLADSLNECQDPSDPTVNFLLRSLATYAMVQAEYFSTGSTNTWSHYGLALEQYTHFTSPIRRYADVIVHRILLSAMEGQDWWDESRENAKQASMQNAELQEMCGHLNDRNRAAQNAQRSSQVLFQTLYFKGRQPDDPRCIVDAVIFSIRTNGFLVYVPRYALKGPVYMENDESQVLFYDAKIGGPVWQKGVLWQNDHELHVETLEADQTYRLFDHVTVTIQMVGSDAHAHKLNFYLLSRKPFSRERNDQIKLDKGEVDFLEELRKEEEEKVNEERLDEMETVKEEQSESKKDGMYGFFQKMKNIGLSTPKDNL